MNKINDNITKQKFKHITDENLEKIIQDYIIKSTNLFLHIKNSLKLGYFKLFA